MAHLKATTPSTTPAARLPSWKARTDKQKLLTPGSGCASSAVYLMLYSAGLVVTLNWILVHGVTVVVTQGPYEGLCGAVAKQISRLFGSGMSMLVERETLVLVAIIELASPTRRDVYLVLGRMLYPRRGAGTVVHLELDPRS